MTALEAIKKIRVALGVQKFEQTAKLMDGITEVHVDGEFAVGETLHVIQEDGTFVPAPEGTHLLEDGRELYVDAAGVITQIEAAAEEAAMEDEEEVVTEEVAMEEVSVEAPVEGEEAVAITEEVVTAVVEALAPIVEEVAAITEEMKKMKASFAKFSGESAGEPVRNNFSKVSKGDTALDARLETIASLRKLRK
jgi:hypothetical protein